MSVDRDRSKPIIKPLKGPGTKSSTNSLFEDFAKNATFQNLEVIGGVDDLQLFNVEIFDSVIENTTIGITEPNIGYFTTLQTGNPSGTGFNVCFYGNTIGEYACWNATQGSWDISGSLFVSQNSRLGNLGITQNTLHSINNNGDINIDPNGFGTIRIEGPVTQHATLGDYLVDLDNGLVNINSRNSITLNSEQGSGTFSVNDHLNLSTLNGDIRLRTEIMTTQNITSITNSTGILQIITSNNHNLNPGDFIVLSNTNSIPLVDGEYTVQNIISDNTFTIIGNVTTNGTTGNLVKKLSNSIFLDAALTVQIPDNIPLTFGPTCNSISANTSSLSIITCNDLQLHVPETNNIYIMNSNTKLQFNTTGNNYISYNEINTELIITTNQIHTNALTLYNDITNVYYKDPILTIGGFLPPITNDLKDRGIEFHYHSGIQSKLGWFGMKNNTGHFTFIPDAINTNEVITGEFGNLEFNNLFVNNINLLNSTGQVNLNCGNIINVSHITGCNSQLIIQGPTDLTLLSSNIHLTANSINIPNNTPFNFSTCGSQLFENTHNNLVIKSCKHITIQTTENSTVSIPFNTLLTFTGSTNGSQSISSNTSGILTISSNNNINLLTTAGHVVIPDNTHLNLGTNTTEYLVANPQNGTSIHSGSFTNIYSHNQIQLQNTTGDILLNSNHTIRIPTNTQFIFDLNNTNNSIHSSSSGSLFINGSINNTQNNIILTNTESINLYSEHFVKLHDQTILTFQDNLQTFITSNQNLFQFVNNQNNTTGITQFISNTLELLNSNINVVNHTLNVTSSNIHITSPNTHFYNTQNFVIHNSSLDNSQFLVRTENVRFKDPIITLSYDTLLTNDFKDRGIEYKYYNSSEKLGWFGWKNNTQRFTFYNNAINTNEVITGTLGEIELGNIFIHDTIQFVSVGEINLNCGNLLNVNSIEGCNGNISINASNNTTLSTGTLSLVVDHSINIPSNTPISFGHSQNNIIGNTAGILTFNAADKIIVNANLEILGNTTTIESTVTTLVDPVFTLGGTQPLNFNDSKDRGIAFHYHTGTEPQLGYFGFDNSSYKFKYLVQATNSNEVLTGIYGDIIINNLCAENIHLNTNSTSGGNISGITNLHGGEINIITTSGNIHLNPTQGQSVLIPYNQTFGFGTTSTSLSSNTAGHLQITSQSLNINTPKSITLNSQESIIIPQYIPLLLGTNSSIQNTGNLEILHSSGNILLSPSQNINASTGHIIIPPNNPITFCNYNNRIESNCDQLSLYGFNGINLNTNVTTINGNLNVVGEISANSQTISFNDFILPLGTSQILNITQIINGPNTGDIDITLNTNHRLNVGDLITLTNTNSIPPVNGNFTINTIVNPNTLRIISTILTTNGSTGSMNSSLVTDPGKDVGIQVNWHTGIIQDSSEAQFGFFGFKKNTQRWTFIENGTNTNNIFTGTLGNIEFNKGFATRMSGFILEGILQGGAQLITGSNFNIEGGEIDNTPIGTTIPSIAQFSTLTSTTQANVQNITINSNLNYSLERFTVSSTSPQINPSVNVILSFINVHGISFNSTSNTLPNGNVDGQVKKLLIETIGNNCQYHLNFSPGQLISPNPLNTLTQPTLITFKRQGQSIELIWSTHLSAWIVSTNGAYIT